MQGKLSRASDSIAFGKNMRIQKAMKEGSKKYQGWTEKMPYHFSTHVRMQNK